jgi:3-methylcrotonyl-CoA carboxylase alpha subunit
MFQRLLIANRGEIACRILRTARRMGIRAIAVYSEADAHALHVRAADEALPIGPAPAAESYLSIERIIAAAKHARAQAIHPGYGFLSENADFADACEVAGLTFVGPPASAIRAMGSKSGAKALMEKAGVPLVPGYHGADQDAIVLTREAARIGFPVLIKPSAGGGGKGMVVVSEASEFAEGLATAKRVAKGAFGEDRVLIEKYLERPRHIEVQVFADGHGNIVHLFTRDCSVQRRHQKVVEEAPAPGLTPDRMKAMGEAAVAAARAVNYVGAGTIEFIVEGDTFAFMEMNTRLQVEHPVTEMVTGIDLVEWQLRVAAGEPLPLRQSQIACTGHAVEVRIYAEDPARDFMPSTGKLAHVAWPEQNADLRIDSGVEQGDSVSVYYDPMLAKIIAHGADRTQALRRLADALDASAVVGVANNLSFLAHIARHPEFSVGSIDTGFIGRHMGELAPLPTPVDDVTLALAALSVLTVQRAEAVERRGDETDPWSPWRVGDGWQLNGETSGVLRFKDGERDLTVGVRHRRDGGYDLRLPGGAMHARAERRSDKMLSAVIDGQEVTALVVRDGDTVHVFGPSGPASIQLVDPLGGSEAAAQAGGHLTAPMPGLVVSVSVAPGQTVARGARLMVIEAMKMEHAIVAPADGVVESVRFGPGDKVAEGEEVIVFEAAAAKVS